MSKHEGLVMQIKWTDARR